jgi:hypothetical protein
MYDNGFLLVANIFELDLVRYHRFDAESVFRTYVLNQALIPLHAGALRSHALAIKLDPTLAEAYMSLGMLYWTQVPPS